MRPKLPRVKRTYPGEHGLRIEFEVDRLDVLARDEQAMDAIDAWAHDYANDAWRALSADEQMVVGRRIVAASQPRGAADALDTLYFELREGNRDSALRAFRELHGDWIERLEQRRVVEGQ